ncbi:MAG: hypothetical protein WA635_10165, partial [Gallionella sp.]
KDLALGSQTVEWYDIPKSCLDNLGAIDLLLVDGPPQAKGKTMQARYPAIPLLYGRLSPQAVVFVDDANRETESKMVERWKAEYPEWHSQGFDTVDGVCILTRAL